MSRRQLTSLERLHTLHEYQAAIVDQCISDIEEALETLKTEGNPQVRSEHIDAVVTAALNLKRAQGGEEILDSVVLLETEAQTPSAQRATWRSS